MSLQNAFQNLAVESKQDVEIAELVTANATLNAISLAVADLDANTDGIEALLTTISSALSDIDTNTDGIEALITQTNAELVTLQGYVDGLETLVTAGNASLSDIDANTDGLEALATAANVLLTDIDTNTDGIEALLTTIDASLADIDANTDGIETLLGTTNTTLASILTSVDQIEGYVDGIEALLGTVVTNTGNTATSTATIATSVKLEDDVAASGDAGIPALGVRNDAAASKTSADGDYSAIATDAAGRVGIADLGGSITVDGTVAVSNPGLTDAQLRATPVPVTDAALATTNANQTNGTQKTQVVDGGGTVLDITAGGAALVHVDRNAQVMDLGTWTPGTDDMVVVGGFVSGTAVSGALALRAGSRGLLVEWVNPAGTAYGTSTNPVFVTGSKVEDAAHVSGDTGNFMLGVRNDADAVRTTADGDYSPISTDSAGRLKVVIGTSALPSGAATEATQLNVLAAVDGIETLLATTATWTHGQATVGTSSAQLPSNANLRGITVKAASSNTVSIYVGNATGVTTATGFELAPGDSIDLSVDNTNDVWHISGTAAQSLSWAAN